MLFINYIRKTLFCRIFTISMTLLTLIEELWYICLQTGLIRVEGIQ
jgi:hypothetical protein